MMIPGLGTLAFMNPWVLAGMASLPVLWFLLRVTPPAPRLIVFPAAHFMAGLDAQKQVPSKTPWPILLLRILAAALIMLALARPVLNPGGAVSGSGPVRIVMDNGWSAAQTWRLQMAQAIDLVERTGRERRPLYIGTTAPEPGKTAPFMAGPLTKGEAEATLRGLKPHPWLADYHAASLLFETAKDNANVQTYWLSSGQRDDVPDRLIRVLQNQGGLTFIAPAPTQRALLLRPDKSKPGQAAAIIEVNSGTPAGVPLTVQVLTRDGRQIDSRDITTDGKQISFKVAFDLPTALQNQISRLQIAGRHSAGSTLLLDSGSYRRRVGIVNTSTAEKAALADATYYIKRALEPVADIQADSLPALLEDDYSVLILPDVGAMPPEDLDILEGWVREGGLLIRFGGPNMTQGDNFLTPVSLRRGDRAMAGALSWDKPAKLAPFPARSPYYGLEIPEDLKIARQLLAEPEPELERKSWAALADGTPLITADHLDDGLIVMIHTTATPEWSNLVLSGLFVKIMERTVQMAGTQALADDNAAAGTLQPQLLLDGHGNNTQPRATDQPIPAAEFESKIPDSTHPPGLYGRVGYQKSLNLGERLPTLRTFNDMPMGVALESYGGVKEQNLMPFILAMALLLFMIDWVVMIILHAGWHLFSNPLRWSQAAAIILCVVIMSAAPARAESEADRIRYAGEIHLAYISTGVADVDALTMRGLQGLSDVLTARTSVEPQGIVALNPENDDLSFFPLIYWAVTPGQATLSGKAQQKIQYYLDHGGTILIDTRDESTTPSGFSGGAGGANAEHLRRLIGGLNVPPLVQMPDDHVLRKSFYLLQTIPGRYNGRTLWVEETSKSGRDGVSSLIIGRNDWVSAWAAGHQGMAMTEQQEMAYRFGVNVMMYALTGNYKADQVHIPHILERLGQ